MFTPDEAARLLRTEKHVIVGVLRMCDLSQSYAQTGLIDAETVRYLYNKLWN
jgi:hypothetical protein